MTTIWLPAGGESSFEERLGPPTDALRHDATVARRRLRWRGRTVLARPRPPTHSGAARIVRLRMRPLSLAERTLADHPTVSLRQLLKGNKPAITGTATMDLAAYTEEILASGFPAIRGLTGRARTLQLDSYLGRIVDSDMDEAGVKVRRPALLKAWLAAYAAASSTSITYSTILDAATPGDGDKPAKATAIRYREALTRLWLLDPIPGWIPEANLLTRLAQAPKHHLADPALAAVITTGHHAYRRPDGIAVIPASLLGP